MASPVFANASGSLSFGTGSIGGSTHKNVRYCRIDMKCMRAIYAFYTRKDTMIQRANAILADQAFGGQGFCLEWADVERIMPDEAYNYTQGIQSLLQKACQWRDMFGFVAFARPEMSAREEIERSQSNYVLTPDEIATRHIKRLTDTMRAQIGLSPEHEYEPASQYEQRRIRDNDDPRIEESKRTNIPIPRANPELRPMGGAISRLSAPQNLINATEEQRARMAKKLMGSAKLGSRELKLYDGDALTESNSRIEFLKKDFEQKTSEIEKTTKGRIDLMEMLITIGEVKIIDIDAGDFFVRIDDMKMTTDIVWVPAWRSSLGNPGTGATTDMGFVDFDPNVSVYCWEDRMPTRDGIIQTRFFELMRKYEMLNEARDNLADADYNAAHPMVFIQQSRAISKVDASELGEEDIYGMAVVGQDTNSIFDKSRMAPTELMSYRRDVRDAVVLEMTVEAGQNAQLQKRVKQIANGTARNTRATRGGLALPEVRANMLEEGGILNLPGGLQFGGIVTPTTVVDLVELRTTYERELAAELGVPLAYIRGEEGSKKSTAGGSTSKTGDSSSSSKTSSSASHSIVESHMKTTVSQYRTAASNFFDYMYDSLFRTKNTNMLKNHLETTYKLKAEESETRAALIRSIERSYRLTQDIAALDETLQSHLSYAARLSAMEVELHRIISLKYRLKLKFLQTPFVENEVMMQLYEVGAITHEEMVNTLRLNVGLPLLDKRAIGKLLDENLDLSQRRAVAATPHPTTSTTEVVESESKGGKAAAPAAGGKGGGGGGGGPVPPEKTKAIKTITTSTEDGSKKSKKSNNDNDEDESEDVASKKKKAKKKE